MAQVIDLLMPVFGIQAGFQHGFEFKEGAEVVHGIEMDPDILKQVDLAMFVDRAANAVRPAQRGFEPLRITDAGDYVMAGFGPRLIGSRIPDQLRFAARNIAQLQPSVWRTEIDVDLVLVAEAVAGERLDARSDGVERGYPYLEFDVAAYGRVFRVERHAGSIPGSLRATSNSRCCSLGGACVNSTYENTMHGETYTVRFDSCSCSASCRGLVRKFN